MKKKSFISGSSRGDILATFNAPSSVHQYSNMAPRLSGQTYIFGVVFFVPKSHMRLERQKKLKQMGHFEPKASEPC